jgi:hypothetical protein
VSGDSFTWRNTNGRAKKAFVPSGPLSSSCKPARLAAASSVCRLWTRRRGREKTASGTDCFHAFPVHAFDVATLEVQPGVDNVLHGLSVRHLSFLGLKSERTRTSATPICKDELSRSHRRQWIMRVDHCPWTQSPIKIIGGVDASQGEGGKCNAAKAGSIASKETAELFRQSTTVSFHVDVSSHPVFCLHPGMERPRFVETWLCNRSLSQVWN